MLGRLPWFALERRRRALRFLVFFDMRFHSSGSSLLLSVTPHMRRGTRQAWRRHLARLPEYGTPFTSVFEQT